jgi:hypothetical protein
MIPTISTDEVTNLLDEIGLAVEALALSAPDATGADKPLKVIVGWPRHEALALPTLSVDAGLVSRRHEPPRVVSVVPVVGSDPPAVLVTWCVQTITAVISLDLWTASIVQRYKLRPLLETLFRLDPGEPAGLRLVLRNSHDTVARVMWQDDTVRDGEGSDDGIRRLAITARAHLNKLVVENRLAANFGVGNVVYTEV